MHTPLHARHHRTNAHNWCSFPRCVQFHAQQGSLGLSPIDLASSVLETLSRSSDPGELQVRHHMMIVVDFTLFVLLVCVVYVCAFVCVVSSLLDLPVCAAASAEAGHSGKNLAQEKCMLFLAFTSKPWYLKNTHTHTHACVCVLLTPFPCCVAPARAPKLKSERVGWRLQSGWDN